MKKPIKRFVKILGYDIINRTTKKQWERKNIEMFEDLRKFNLLIGSKSQVVEIMEKFRELKISDYLNGLLFDFQGLKIYIESIEEINILHEVFCAEVYGFKPYNESILIDVGTNIGLTALYFSTNENIKEIYCFEPVQDTFEQAKLNFNLNDCSKVVSFENIGLYNDNENINVVFSSQFKGNTGIRGKKSSVLNKRDYLETRNIILKNASESLRQIVLKNNCHIILKLDCEGAEYTILEDICTSNVIDRIDTIMIEWHDNGAEYLIEKLVQKSFKCFNIDQSKNSGIIYATK